MIGFVVVYLIVLIAVLYLMSGKELFSQTVFITRPNAEFRGINLLGLNSVDGHFACSNSEKCREVCGRNDTCKGYSFYHPGQRCYLFGSGNFVEDRPGFFSGKKIEY